MNNRNYVPLFLIILSFMPVLLIATPVYAFGSGNDGGNYIGPEGCKYCHLEKYNGWLETNHSRVFEILVSRGQEENDDCLPCHTTGYNNDTKTYEFKDVTCEVCHGSGDISNTITRQVIETFYLSNNMDRAEIDRKLEELNLNQKSMVKDFSSELCGRCHQDKHHPTYEEWNESDHAQSLVDLKESDHAKDVCLECHSSEYIIAEEHNKPTLETVTTPLTCVACHDVHNNGNKNLLRKPKKDLCESCHTMGESAPGATPHHAQSEMRRSDGGVDVDTYIYQPNAACADCHRYTRAYNETGQEEHTITGHTFNINYSVCLTCHEGFASAEVAHDYDTKQEAEIFARFIETEQKVEQAKTITENMTGSQAPLYKHVYDEARFDLEIVRSDASNGSHNPKYAMELLDKADFKAQNIIDGKPEKKSPGFDLVPGFLSLMVAMVLLRKRSKEQ
ncbi:MAG: hypothetical protein M8352_04985 [ANME-2 cluster archaeon]|nr:hypothetical protein [ANME-2 cluster archaeon]